MRHPPRFARWTLPLAILALAACQPTPLVADDAGPVIVEGPAGPPGPTGPTGPTGPPGSGGSGSSGGVSSGSTTGGSGSSSGKLERRKRELERHHRLQRRILQPSGVQL